MTREELTAKIEEILEQTPITDIHTHLYTNDFGGLLLWGIDELLTYHYLVAETLRVVDLEPAAFWKLDKTQQADLVWKTLFVDRSPISEACRGVLTCLAKLGLDVESRDLQGYREYFASLTPEQYIDKVLELSNVETVVMTNDPFDPAERSIWEQGGATDPRFRAVLRLDPLLVTTPQGISILRELGYNVEAGLSKETLSEVRRFLNDWLDKMDALYMAVSLPPSFAFPANNLQARLIEHCVLPVSRERNVPFAMMIGVKKLVNPELILAGDSVGKSCIEAVEYLCANYPENKFLVTMLARENQHELAVAARKYKNLMLFGCWWFLNNPSLIEEMTRMRTELLGLSYLPQHSDARVLDQLIYKWAHSREIIGKVLVDKYSDLGRTGWKVTEAELKRDIEALLGGNFWRFLEM